MGFLHSTEQSQQRRGTGAHLLAEYTQLFTAAGRAVFLDRLFDSLTGFAGALLNAPQQLLLLAFHELEVVFSELGPLLFEFALGDVPVAFDFKFGHCIVFSMVRRRP